MGLSGVLGLSPAPWRLCPHVKPSRCPAGAISGDTSVALGLSPATHVGGQRRAPTGRMPGVGPQPLYIGWGYLRMYGG
jgi:hypothetical protein